MNITTTDMISMNMIQSVEVECGGHPGGLPVCDSDSKLESPWQEQHMVHWIKVLRSDAGD